LLKVLDSPGASLLTWLVIGIALALPVGLNVALDNVGRLSTNWDSPAQLSLFLRDGLADERPAQLVQELRERADVKSATFVSREAALAEFTALSGFGDILASLDQNPLPHLLLVTPLESLTETALRELRAELAATPEVAEAVLDMDWLRRLHNILEISQRLVLVVGGMLVLGVVLILGNTIRLAIESRRDEIVIVKLVGGSNGFVRRPFLYTGLWYGVGGGLLAGLLVEAALWYVRAPVGRLAALYESPFYLSGLGVMGVLNLLLVGAGLGLAGAWLAVSRHLADIEPR
tara:strand:- start:19796 stop:20662 length:867 start_codon:yes stop_codon:yes gene_type:complete